MIGVKKIDFQDECVDKMISLSNTSKEGIAKRKQHTCRKENQGEIKKALHLHTLLIISGETNYGRA